MKEMYFIICNGDGDTSVDMITKEELTKRINEDGDYESVKFLDKIPDRDTNYWGGGDYMLVIKGKIVTPTPVTTVTKFKIE